jgi:hypothetical protein
MKLSELCLEVVSPEVHAANKKIALKIVDTRTKEKLSKLETPRRDTPVMSHIIKSFAKDKKNYIRNETPADLHRRLKFYAKTDAPHSKADDMAREHFKTLGSKLSKAAKKLQD